MDKIVRIEHVTTRKMNHLSAEHLLRSRPNLKHDCEIDAAFKLFKIGMTIIAFEWKINDMDGGEMLFATFGKLQK